MLLQRYVFVIFEYSKYVVSSSLYISFYYFFRPSQFYQFVIFNQHHVVYLAMMTYDCQCTCHVLLLLRQQITKMIEDAVADKDKGAIPLDTLTQWLADNELISIILSGSIDQAQYCDKVKRIVEHIAPYLSKEDLERLWNRTVCVTFV